jgi:hypothetical protein
MAGVDESPAAALTGLRLGGRAGLLDLAELLRPVPASGGPRLDLPLYAGIAVRDEAAADLFVRNVRASLGPVPIDSRSLGAHRGIAITRVERRLAGAASARVALFPPIYYAVCRSTLTFALGEETLRHRIDDCLDGRFPRLEAKPKLKRAEAGNAAAGGDWPTGAQLVADVDLPASGALWSVAGGLIEQLASPDQGASAAETIFRGAPGLDATGARALAMAYLGGAPVTPEGAAYLSSEAGVVDPVRGSAHAPRPAAAAAHERRFDPELRAWLDALAHARFEISFDGEPATPGGTPMQSAHVHLTVRRAPPGH